MKIDLKLPSGAELHYEHPPMEKDRLEMICWTIGVTVAVVAGCALLARIFG